MDSTIRIGSSIVFPISSSSPKLSNLRRKNKIEYGFRFGGNGCVSALTPNGSVSPSAASHGVSLFLVFFFGIFFFSQFYWNLGDRLLLIFFLFSSVYQQILP